MMNHLWLLLLHRVKMLPVPAVDRHRLLRRRRLPMACHLINLLMVDRIDVLEAENLQSL